MVISRRQKNFVEFEKSVFYLLFPRVMFFTETSSPTGGGVGSPWEKGNTTLVFPWIGLFTASEPGVMANSYGQITHHPQETSRIHTAHSLHSLSSVRVSTLSTPKKPSNLIPPRIAYTKGGTRHEENSQMQVVPNYYTCTNMTVRVSGM